MFDFSRPLFTIPKRMSLKDRGEKSKRAQGILSAAEIQNSLPVLEKSSKFLGEYDFSQLDNSSPDLDDEVTPAPEYDSHNQLIPSRLQLKRCSSSQRYKNRQHKLAQELSMKLIALLPKQLPPLPGPEPRKILYEYIRVRKLRQDKCGVSFSLPKPLLVPRNPSPLRQELARGSTS